MVEGGTRAHHAKHLPLVRAANVCSSPMSEEIFNTLREDVLVADLLWIENAP